MSKIINDFVKMRKCRCGIGYFENDAIALKFAINMKINQYNKCIRHKIIPANFYKYLKEKKMIPKNYYIPDKEKNVKNLLDLLWNSNSEGLIMRDALLVELHPELVNKMGSSQHVWRKGEKIAAEYGKVKGR
ncbi:hypothetical protein KQH27_00660 [bacterium]|nr:hypothetical protein [bacterium]